MENERHCIKCPKRPLLVRKKVDEVVVDLCPICHGLWLDKDEIFQLGEQSDEALEKLRRLVQAQPGSDSSISPGEPCLGCGQPLAQASLGTFHVEHCVSCGGLFLDRGELDQVMALAEKKQIATVVALARSVIASGSTK